ncbi:hypothetical protein C8J57DRAFT_1251301 [Mycena rebaudengoi]|nr:hypothetical protein C8J57DRAFT_1251301 [Mycena rebaudengoi]
MHQRTHARPHPLELPPAGPADPPPAAPAAPPPAAPAPAAPLPAGAAALPVDNPPPAGPAQSQPDSGPPPAEPPKVLSREERARRRSAMNEAGNQPAPRPAYKARHAPANGEDHNHAEGSSSDMCNGDDLMTGSMVDSAEGHGGLGETLGTQLGGTGPMGSNFEAPTGLPRAPLSVIQWDYGICRCHLTRCALATGTVSFITYVPPNALEDAMNTAVKWKAVPGKAPPPKKPHKQRSDKGIIRGLKAGSSSAGCGTAQGAGGTSHRPGTAAGAAAASVRRPTAVAAHLTSTVHDDEATCLAKERLAAARHSHAAEAAAAQLPPTAPVVLTHISPRISLAGLGIKVQWDDGQVMVEAMAQARGADDSGVMAVTAHQDDHDG